MNRTFTSRLSLIRHEDGLGARALSIRADLHETIVAAGIMIHHETVPGALSITIGDQIVVPSWQFVTVEDLSLHPEIPILAELLGAESDPLGAVAWCVTPNSWLHFRQPYRILGTIHSSELVFAANQLNNDEW